MPKANVNGTILHYHVHGRGTPIVFIHPPLLNRAVFRYQEVQLADLFRVVTFDIRGHGFSAPSEAPITYRLIAEDVKGLLDVLNIRTAYLCGYSTGAGAAVETMLAFPDRIRGAVLVGAMLDAEAPLLRLSLSLASGMAASGMKTTLALAFALGNADMKETFRNLYYDAVRGDPRNWRQYFDASKSWSAMDRLGAVKAPALLVYGARDYRFLAHAERIRKRLPDATLAFIPEAKHGIPIKAAGALHDVMTKWILRRELAAAERGETYADRAWLKKAEETDLRIPDGVLAEEDRL